MPSNLFQPITLNHRPVMDFQQSKINEGLSFTATHTVTVGTVTAGTVLLTVPATGIYHLRGTIRADKAGTWTLSKAPNASAGTTIASINNNERSSNTDTMTVTHTATWVSSGTVIINGLIGADSGLTNLCADIDGTSEIILAASRLYLVRFVAAAATTTVAINLRYYREA